MWLCLMWKFLLGFGSSRRGSATNVFDVEVLLGCGSRRCGSATNVFDVEVFAGLSF